MSAKLSERKVLQKSSGSGSASASAVNFFERTKALLAVNKAHLLNESKIELDQRALRLQRADLDLAKQTAF